MSANTMIRHNEICLKQRNQRMRAALAGRIPHWHVWSPRSRRVCGLFPEAFLRRVKKACTIRSAYQQM